MGNEKGEPDSGSPIYGWLILFFTSTYLFLFLRSSSIIATMTKRKRTNIPNIVRKTKILSAER